MTARLTSRILFAFELMGNRLFSISSGEDGSIHPCRVLVAGGWETGRRGSREGFSVIWKPWPSGPGQRRLAQPSRTCSGKLEQWNDGMMGFKATKRSCGVLIPRLLVAVLSQYSTIPTFHYSGLSEPLGLNHRTNPRMPNTMR